MKCRFSIAPVVICFGEMWLKGYHLIQISYGTFIVMCLCFRIAALKQLLRSLAITHNSETIAEYKKYSTMKAMYKHIVRDNNH